MQYIDWQKTDKALAAFEAALQLKHDHLGAWMNRALLLDKTGTVATKAPLQHGPRKNNLRC